MIRIGRLTAVLGIGVLALVGLLAERNDMQAKIKEPPQPPQPSTTGGTHSSIKIFEDSSMPKAVEIGGDCIGDKDWPQAIKILQQILDSKTDHFVVLSEPDPFNPLEKVTRSTSVKFEANNLLGTMDIKGLDIYEAKFGESALILLKEANAKGDQVKLAEVAQRFCHTKAGIQANELLATLALSRGQVFSAALRYDTILKMKPEWTKVNDAFLYKAALAFRRAGDLKNSQETWEKLKYRNPGGWVPIGNRSEEHTY